MFGAAVSVHSTFNQEFNRTIIWGVAIYEVHSPFSGKYPPLFATFSATLSLPLLQHPLYTFVQYKLLQALQAS
jgi:hypothetical protein